jgi:hypothetical protein
MTGTKHPMVGFGTYKVGFIPASASAAAGMLKGFSRGKCPFVGPFVGPFANLGS